MLKEQTVPQNSHSCYTCSECPLNPHPKCGYIPFGSPHTQIQWFYEHVDMKHWYDFEIKQAEGWGEHSKGLYLETTPLLLKLSCYSRSCPFSNVEGSGKHVTLLLSWLGYVIVRIWSVMITIWCVSITPCSVCVGIKPRQTLKWWYIYSSEDSAPCGSLHMWSIIIGHCQFEVSLFFNLWWLLFIISN